MAKPKILVIEDERPLVEVLTYNLEREGFEVLVAYDGQDGLRQAQLRLPDLVVLDLMLPVKAGPGACRGLRAGARQPGRPRAGAAAAPRPGRARPDAAGQGRPGGLPGAPRRAPHARDPDRDGN